MVGFGAFFDTLPMFSSVVSTLIFLFSTFDYPAKIGTWWVLVRNKKNYNQLSISSIGDGSKKVAALVPLEHCGERIREVV